MSDSFVTSWVVACQAPLSLEFLRQKYWSRLAFLHGSDGKESACNVGDSDSVPGSGRSPGAGNANLFPDSCLENSMDKGAWRATIHRVAKGQIWLSDLCTPDAISFSQGSSWPKSLALAGRFFTAEPPEKPTTSLSKGYTESPSEGPKFH